MLSLHWTISIRLYVKLLFSAQFPLLWTQWYYRKCQTTRTKKMNESRRCSDSHTCHHVAEKRDWLTALPGSCMNDYSNYIITLRRIKLSNEVNNKNASIKIEQIRSIKVKKVTVLFEVQLIFIFLIGSVSKWPTLSLFSHEAI